MATGNWIPIEEAALRLDRSVQTLRRWAAAGIVPAQKRGRGWWVDSSWVGPRSGVAPPGTQALLGVDIDTAWDHLRQVDLNQPWIPDVLAYADYLVDPVAVKSLALARLSVPGPFDPVAPVDVPRTSLLTRKAAVLSVVDRLVFQAAVQSIAPRADKLLSDTVFSARLSTNAGRFLKKPTLQWVRWIFAVRKALVAGNPWMVSTDLVSYYDTIQHRLLFADIDALNPDPKISLALKRMLGTWSDDSGVGIPQGPEASAVLANLYLVPIDYAMESDSWSCFRYMDDFRIVGPTRNSVLRGLRMLEQECRRRGLIISTDKTVEVSGPAAVKAVTDSLINQASYVWETKPWPAGKELLMAVLERGLMEDREPEARSLRFSLGRLSSVQDPEAVWLILGRLEHLSQVARITARYLWPWLNEEPVAVEVESFLTDPNRNFSPVLSSWLIAGFLDWNVPVSRGLTAYSRRVVRDPYQPPYLRALAASLLGLSGMPSDLVWTKAELRREFDPTLARGYLVALARAKALDKGSWRDVISRSPELQRTVAYLEGRQSFPGLLHTQPPVRRTVAKAAVQSHSSPLRAT